MQISPYNDNISVSVYNYDRELQIAFLTAVFLIVVWLVGGKRYKFSIIALAFTVVMVVCMYVPMMYIGISSVLYCCSCYRSNNYSSYIFIDS